MGYENLTYEQCVAQGIGPLVFPERLRVTGDGSRVTDAQRAQMKVVCVHTMQQQVQIRRIQSMALHALEEAGIDAVLMKGAGLAVLYPSPEMRQWGDVDLFVGKEQYHQAAAVMRATFPKALKFDEELDHYKHYNLIADGISIEIHRVSMGLTHPRDIRLYARMEAYGMAHSEWAEWNGERFRVPEPTFNTLMVFLHSWEHMLSEGANLRQLVDVQMLLTHYKDRIDNRRLHRWLKQLRLEDVWALYMEVIKGERLTARGERFLNALLHPQVKVKGERLEVSGNRFVRKFHTMQERMKNADRIAAFSPAYARHMKWGILWSGLARLFAKDRHWE